MASKLHNVSRLGTSVSPQFATGWQSPAASPTRPPQDPALVRTLAETYVDRFGDDEQRLQPPPDPELLAMIETVKAERRAAVGCKPAPVVRPFRRDHHRLWRAAAVGVALGAAACGGCWAVVSH